MLAALSTFGPLTTDLYLPGLPQVADRLDATPSQVQATLTFCLLGLALGQAIVGPLSDSHGRRRPLLAGLVLFVIATLGCAAAPSVVVLDGLRLLQGLCGAAGIVLARAIVRDLWSGAKAAQMYATLMGAVSLGPIIAPPLGGLLLGILDWRGLFVVLAGFGVVLFAGASLFVPETLPTADRRPAGARGTAHAARDLIGDRRFIGCALTGALIFGSLFSYISGSSFVYQDVYGTSAQVYGLLFALNGVALLVGSLASRRLQERLGAARLLTAGLVTLAVAALVLVAVVIAGLGLVAFVVPLWIGVGAVGLGAPNAVAIALSDRTGDMGTASAVIGVLQFAVGALAAPLSGVAGTSAIPMAVAMAGFAVAALAMRWFVVR